MKRILPLVTHCAALALGGAIGIYLLPILTEPKGPDALELTQAAADAQFNAEFSRDLPGSDFLHWGTGSIHLDNDKITHIGALAPGPDYKLYLTPEFVTDEAGFTAFKTQSVQIGDVKMFGGFILDLPAEINIEDYTSVVIWCEAFGEFITAAQYR